MRTGIFLRAGSLVIGSLLVLTSCSGSGDGDSASSATPARLTEEGSALTSLVEKAQVLTYHATYRISGEQPAEGSISVQLWRKGDRVRLDQEIRSEDRVVRTAGFRLEGQTVGCTREGEDPWRCTAIDQPRPSPGDASADPLIGGLVGELAVSEVKAGTEEIDGRQVRCYKAKDGSREVCVSADEGIAVRIATPQSRLELDELERDVDESIFEPPAEPTQTGQ